jgi:hypothetical protein
MRSPSFVSARVRPDTKERVGDLCRQLGIAESELLRRLIRTAIANAQPAAFLSPRRAEPRGPRPRVSVRLRPDDILLLRERARGQQLSVSTCAGSIVRIHLQAQTPVPTAEIAELKLSIAEVNEIGRMLNDVARAMSQRERADGPSLADLGSLLDALIRMRDRVRALVDANSASWGLGPQDPKRDSSHRSQVSN